MMMMMLVFFVVFVDDVVIFPVSYPTQLLGWDPESVSTDGLQRTCAWSNNGMTFRNTGPCWLNRYLVEEPIKHPYIVEVEYDEVLGSFLFSLIPLQLLLFGLSFA
jgi:hypothetical protein